MDPLAILFAECEARAAAPVGVLGVDHIGEALGALASAQTRPEVREVAVAAMAAVAPRVLADAAWVGHQLRDDPAAPGLETIYLRTLGELSDLAVVLSDTEGWAPVDASIKALLDASRNARPTWDLMRRLRVAARVARGRPPPPRMRNRLRPLADDAEYYFVR